MKILKIERIVKTFKKAFYIIAGSANGRPMDSESINLGSNPSPAVGKMRNLEITKLFLESVKDDADFKEAVDLGVSAPVITASLQRRFRSRQEDSFGERILAALRAEFGGHAVKYKP